MKCLMLLWLLGRGGASVCVGMIGLPFGVFVGIQGALRKCFFGGVVRSIESVFFCGCVLSVVISVCLVVGVYSGGGRPFAILEDSNPRCMFRPRLVIVLLELRVLRTHTVRSPSLAHQLDAVWG